MFCIRRVGGSEPLLTVEAETVYLGRKKVVWVGVNDGAVTITALSPIKRIIKSDSSVWIDPDHPVPGSLLWPVIEGVAIPAQTSG